MQDQLPEYSEIAWQTLYAALDFDQGQQQARWADEVERRLKENGMTYQAHTQSQKALRQGRLDVVPYLMDEGTFATLSAGLIQRVRLFEAILADIYGPRQLLADGTLPPNLVFANPEYVIQSHGLELKTPWIGFLAHDLLLDANGQWRVLGCSTRAPAGLGYALERRMIMSRVMGYLLRQLSVKRLSGFFRTLRGLLRDESHTDELSILLSPGQQSDSYFEHAFLANYLDFTLAEGDDLTVRGGRLMLKTLSGLRPVSGVMRRVPDHDLDPLEMHGFSRQGTPGLMEVVRQGRVRMANVPGAGVIDSPLWMGRFERLCERLLGETLLLPSVAAWWLGDAEEHAQAMAIWPAILVRHASVFPSGPSYVVADLSAEAQAALQQRIAADPAQLVAWEAVQIAETQVAQGTERIAAHGVVRLYTAQGLDRTVEVMPGGLAACNRDFRWAQLRTNMPELYKDIWVMGAEPDNQASILAEKEAPVLGSHDQSMTPSRVADAMFWLGRYVERCDSLTRVLRECLLGLIDVRLDRQQAGIWLLRYLTPVETDVPASVIAEIHRVFFTPGGAQSFSELVDAIMRNARATPDYLSDDALRALVNLEQLIARANQIRTDDPGRLLDQIEAVLMQLASFSGLNNDTMSRTFANRFMDIGRHLERASRTLVLLHYGYQTLTPQHANEWEMILEVTDTVMTYRRRYRTRLHPVAILDLLLLDEETPRAIGYLASRIERQVASLPVQQLGGRKTQLQRLGFGLHAHVQMIQVDELMTAYGAAKKPLFEQLTGLVNQLSGLSEAITLAYFSHADVPQQLLKASR